MIEIAYSFHTHTTFAVSNGRCSCADDKLHTSGKNQRKVIVSQHHIRQLNADTPVQLIDTVAHKQFTSCMPKLLDPPTAAVGTTLNILNAK